MKHFLGDLDREALRRFALDTKNQPTSINICHIGSLNANLVHPREVVKSAILSNAASIMVGYNHPSGRVLSRVNYKKSIYINTLTLNTCIYLEKTCILNYLVIILDTG